MGAGTVISLKEKVEKLISMYESLKVENEGLKRKVEELSEQSDVKTQKISTLERKNNSLQLTEAMILASGSRAEAKRKVAAMMREIDRCIGMLNE